MLVDLARNDVGRISKYGSVQVPEFMKVHQYSHVQHIVSRVVGQLKDGLQSYDALRAVFPAGTVSGAPKVRAMEIIDESETCTAWTIRWRCRLLLIQRQCRLRHNHPNPMRKKIKLTFKLAGESWLIPCQKPSGLRQSTRQKR